MNEEDEYTKHFRQSTLNLTFNDSKTLLKDMKDILTNLKVITEDMARITTSIDVIVGIIENKE